MALTKVEKQEVVKEVTELLGSSKLTVVAKYEGTGVKALQGLRRDAKANGTKVKVIKNRLVIQALKNVEDLKSIDTSALQGMLIYAFNSEDEVAPAQSLHTFAKANPNLEFVGAISADGHFMPAEDVKMLAVLPRKDQLIAGLISILESPVRGVVGSLSGNLHGLLQGLEAKATN
jgi:large subunit ribosomal protein L10